MVRPSPRRTPAAAPCAGADGADGADGALAVLCRALLPDVDALTDRLVARILEREDVYGAGLHDDLRATCRASLERSLLVLAGDLPDDVDPAAVIVDTGVRRARQDVPLEVVLRAYQWCGRLLWDRMVAVSRERFGGAFDAELLAAADDVWRMIDNSSARLVEAYHREEDRLRRRADDRRHAAVEGLLAGRGADPAFARDAARVLGLAEDGPLVCVVTPVPAAGDDPGEGEVAPERARHAREVLAAAGLASVWHARTGEVVGLVPLPGDDGTGGVAAVAAALGRDRAAGPAAGVSPPVAGPAEVDVAHRWARLAARTVPADGDATVGVLDDRLPEALLVESPELAARLRRAAFGPVLDLPAAERTTLLRTLAAVVAADGSPSRAAPVLYCHRNTVMYRLARLEELTGRRLADPRDRLVLQLALAAGEPPGAPGP